MIIYQQSGFMVDGWAHQKSQQSSSWSSCPPSIILLLFDALWFRKHAVVQNKDTYTTSGREQNLGRILHFLWRNTTKCAQNALKMRTALRPLVEYPENSSQKRQRANSYGPSGCGPTPGNAHVMKKPGKGKLKGFWMTHIFPGEGPASVPSHMRLRTFHGPAIP